MAESNKNPQDDHIEDLLSQLQGIFGKLSRQEEDEAKDKVELPKPKSTPPPASTPKPFSLDPTPLSGPFDLQPPSAEPPPKPASTPKPAPAPVPPPVSIPKPLPVTPPPVVPPPMPAAAPEPKPIPPAPAPAPVPPPAAPPPAAPTPEPVVEAPPVLDDSQLATHIAFPIGRDTEAKSLQQRLETITPKFTKVAFRLKVTRLIPYDPKSDWKDAVQQQVVGAKGRALFLVLDRPLEDARRKGMIADMEKSGVYFQEVPLISIEKKAFYTDVLLGLVFFMDSQKPGESGQAA